jgi:hypothetical protein
MRDWIQVYYSLLTVEGTSNTVPAKLVALGTGIALAALAYPVLHALIGIAGERRGYGRSKPEH